MVIRRLTLTGLVILLAKLPLFAHGTMTYTVDLRDTKSHTVHVTMKPSGFSAKTAHYQMPVWAPGAYSVTHYGKYIANFKAYNKYDHILAVTRVSDDRWDIASGQSVKKIEYDVLDSHKDTTSLYFAMANIDTSIFFANATALFGYYDDDKNASAQVRYELPELWKLSCPLDPGKDPDVIDPAGAALTRNFVANNYDVLADAPVLAAPTSVPATNAPYEMGAHPFRMIASSFHEGPADYDVAVVTDGPWSSEKMDSLTYYLDRIVHAETDFFHDVPFRHYTFEIVAPTLSRMPSFAQGALEHANASDYLVADFGWPMFKGYFLSTFSHEFFHLWNVKRIHSNLLGPFDYTQRVMTTSLWMAEGITEYYAHTLLSRYGIISPARFYSDVEEWRREMEMAPPSANAKSLEELSIDESIFDMGEATLFYSRGPLVAMMLDIEIRTRTGNKKSLDDVMLALNNDAKHGKTFREEDLIKKVEAYAGIDLTDFYNKYIHGTDSLPLDDYLAKMGILANNVPVPEPHPPMMIHSASDSTWVITSLDSTSTFATSGLKIGDRLNKVNGEKITKENVMDVLFNQDTIHLTIDRDGRTSEVVVKPRPLITSMHSESGPVTIDPNASPLAAAIRKGIVGSE